MANDEEGVPGLERAMQRRRIDSGGVAADAPVPMAPGTDPGVGEAIATAAGAPPDGQRLRVRLAEGSAVRAAPGAGEDDGPAPRRRRLAALRWDSDEQVAYSLLSLRMEVAAVGGVGQSYP